MPALLKKAKEEKAVVLFGDEVSFAIWGSLARTWAPIGQQPTVKTRGIRGPGKCSARLNWAVEAFNTGNYSLIPCNKNAEIIERGGSTDRIAYPPEDFKGRAVCNRI